MALKTFKPVTPSLRQLVIVDRSELYKGKPRQGADRGQVVSRAAATTPAAITVRFRGGGHKQTYRIIDFKRRKLDMPAKVERIEYDPNRTVLHRADHAMRTASRPTSSRRSGSRVGDEVVAGAPGRREARQRHAAGQHAGRHDRAQRRDEDRQGRRHRPLGRHLRADRRPRPGLRDRAPELGRAAPGPRPVLRARSARCRTPTT